MFAKKTKIICLQIEKGALFQKSRMKNKKKTMIERFQKSKMDNYNCPILKNRKKFLQKFVNFRSVREKSSNIIDIA